MTEQISPVWFNNLFSDIFLYLSYLRDYVCVSGVKGLTEAPP